MHLAELQAAFAATLRDGGGSVDPAPLSGQIRPAAIPTEAQLAIYRRTSHHAQRSALRQAYPVIEALIGPDLFAVLAAAHIAAPGSRSGDLHRFGAEFERTFESEPACADLRYLNDVARLEWVVHRSFFAADAPHCACVDPATVPASEHARLTLVPHPSLHVLACSGPAADIWQAHQSGHSTDFGLIDLAAGPEWLAVYRREEAVRIDRLSAADHSVLASSLAGEALMQGLERVGDVEFDLAARLPVWLQAGLLSGLGLLAPGPR